jgi:hypothetical protein
MLSGSLTSGLAQGGPRRQCGVDSAGPHRQHFIPIILQLSKTRCSLHHLHSLRISLGLFLSVFPERQEFIHHVSRLQSDIGRHVACRGRHDLLCPLVTRSRESGTSIHLLCLRRTLLTASIHIIGFELTRLMFPGNACWCRARRGEATHQTRTASRF